MFWSKNCDCAVQIKLLEARIIVLEAQIKGLRDEMERVDKKSRSVAGLVYRKGYKEEQPEEQKQQSQSPIYGMEFQT